MFLPIFCSTGFALSNAATDPPTMNVSVPASAPPTPPDTGASTVSRPASLACLARVRDTVGSMVEQSISSEPFLIAPTTLP